MLAARLRRLRKARFQEPEAAVRTLLGAYVDSSPIVRAAAARVGGGIAGPHAETALLLLLHDHHPDVYMQATRSLRHRGVRVESHLQWHLFEGPEGTRHWSAQTLAKLGLPSAAVFLLGALFEQNLQVVTAAATGLLLIPDPDVIPALVQALQHLSPAARASAITGLSHWLPDAEPTWFTMVRVCRSEVDRHLETLGDQMLSAGLAPVLEAELQEEPEHADRCRMLLAALRTPGLRLTQSLDAFIPGLPRR